MTRELSVTPRMIVAEFEKRGIVCKPLDTHSPLTVLEFTDQNGRRRYISGTLTDKSNAVARRIADDKLTTSAIAAQIGLQVPATEVYESAEQAAAFLQQYSPVVVKPLDGAHGNGVSVNIDTEAKLQAAVKSAQQHADIVLLQQQVHGNDTRLLYIGGEFCAAAQRNPASVTGDGQHTVQELIDIVNAHPERGYNYQKKYNVIPLAISEVFLGEAMQSVPAEGQEVQVIGTANIGSGGTAVDVTDTLSAELIEQGKRLAAELQMGVCGVDFIVTEAGNYLIEINASPSFGLHHHPHEGQPRDVTAAFVDWLLA